MSTKQKIYYFCERKTRYYARNNWKKIADWGQSSGCMSINLQSAARDTASKIKYKHKFTPSDIRKAIIVYEAVCKDNIELLEEADAMAEQEAENATTIPSNTQPSNDMTLELVQKMVDWDRRKRILEDWIEQYAEKAKLSHKCNGYESMLRSVRFQLLAYMGNIAKTKLLQAINEEFCIGFITFLNNATTSNGKPLSGTTIYHYSRWLKDILQRAVTDELITHNPIDKLIQNKEMPTHPEVQMDYLTIDEVKTLMQTPLKQAIIKQAFLFACFTGLRINDVRNLQWGNIKTDGDTTRFEIIMKKTDTPLTGKIPNIAKEWMPEPTNSPFVFANLSTASNIDTVIRRWVAQSGIKKHVTFHTARHTFATMGLTLGTDLYTVSKLLGHKSIATTQVYAQFIDKKKDEASDLLDNAF